MDSVFHSHLEIPNHAHHQESLYTSEDRNDIAIQERILDQTEESVNSSRDDNVFVTQKSGFDQTNFFVAERAESHGTKKNISVTESAEADRTKKNIFGEEKDQSDPETRNGGLRSKKMPLETDIDEFSRDKNQFPKEVPLPIGYVPRVNFDPSSPFTQYVDEYECGPRGDDALPFLWGCEKGYYVLKHEPFGEYDFHQGYPPVATIDGCNYFEYRIYACVE